MGYKKPGSDCTVGLCPHSVLWPSKVLELNPERCCGC